MPLDCTFCKSFLSKLRDRKEEEEEGAHPGGHRPKYNCQTSRVSFIVFYWIEMESNKTAPRGW